MSGWLKNAFTRCSATSRRPVRRQTFRPRLTTLEDRLAPATLTVTNTADSGAGSLRDCVQKAAPGDTIVFSPAIDNQTITLKSQIQISNVLTITGRVVGVGGALVDKISGGNATRIFDINNAATNVSFNALVLENGEVTGDNGGAILVEPNCALGLSNCILQNNTAHVGGGVGGNGGAIENDGITNGSNNCLFTNNVADNQGGAINNTGQGVGQAPVRQPSHHHGRRGSAIGAHSHARQHTITPLAPAPGPVSPALQMQGSSFYTNTAKRGGAISTSGNTLIANCIFGGAGAVLPNTATGLGDDTGLGGAIYADGEATPTSKLTVTASTFTGNQALNSGSGGAIYSSMVADVETSTFASNSAARHGGAIYYVIVDLSNPPVAYSSSLTVNQDTFTGNMVQSAQLAGYGGAVATYSTLGAGSDTVKVTNSTFYQNLCSSANGVGRGGGLDLIADLTGNASATASFVNDTFFKNSIDNVGGGVSITLGNSGTGTNTAALTSLTINQNTAVNKGGGLYVDAAAGTVSVDNNIFDGNEVTVAGYNGPPDVTNTAAFRLEQYNLVGTSDNQFNPANGDILNDNPGLAGALANNNAKPYYPQTLALAVTSPGHEKGDQNLPNLSIPYYNDARGRIRQRNKVSIGAEDPDAI